MNKLKAVFFDFDGTLVHSIDLLVDLFTECLIEQGVEPAKPEEIRRLIGEPLDDIFHKLTNLVDIERFNKSFHSKEDARHTAEHIRLIRDTIPTLKFLKEQGLKLGIVSTKQRELVEPLSKELDIHSFFDVIIGGWDVENCKPHPEPILMACERAEVKPNESIYVGDSLLDLGAAKNAKTTFVGVLTGTATRQEFEKNKADYIFSHIGEISELTRKLLS